MPPTLGLVANIYNEVNALPGWLETHLPFFDDVRVYHAGPQGELSNDGTMEILEKWRIPYLVGSIDDGFGAVRTRAIRSSPCDWVMILDADERFFPVHRELTCHGEGTPQSDVDWILQSYDFRGVNLPNWENIAKLGENLRVEVGKTYDQGQRLRDLIVGAPCDAIATVRRHWHDFSFHKPTQSWNTHPDWQLRIVRNCDRIHYASDTKMHERLVGAIGIQNSFQVYFDHFHFSMKKLEIRQRGHDVAIYNAIHAGRKPPTLEEFNGRG